MAAEEQSEDEIITEAPVTPAAAPGGNKLVLILTAVNMVATLGMVAVLFISFHNEKRKPRVEDISAQSEKHEEKGKEGEGGGRGEAAGGHSSARFGKDFGRKIALEQFNVNLSTAGSVNPKFARVAIVLEVPGDDVEAEVTQKMPQVRNVIIDLLNSKKVSDLATVEGKNYLKEEIRSALNSFLVTGKVTGVYFTNFVVAG